MKLGDGTLQALGSEVARPRFIEDLLGLACVFGTDLPKDAAFRTALRDSYDAIPRLGVLGASRTRKR